MLASTIRKCVDILAPKTELPDNWDAHLPHSADILLNTGQRLVVAVCHPQHLLSLVSGDQISSVLISSDSENSDLTEKIRLLIPPSSSRIPASQPILRGSDFPANRDVNYRTRDPNAPPGFENETQPSSNVGSVPQIHFDPDQDRLPVGGRYPTLSPMVGTVPPPDLFTTEGGGMHPRLTNQPRRNVRYDPTSPFDSSPFGNSPFGDSSPFGPRGL